VKAAETYLWNFAPREPKDGDDVQCPEPGCLAWSPLADWREIDIPCELCGDHPGLVCPVCYEAQDHVFDHLFQVRTPE